MRTNDSYTLATTMSNNTNDPSSPTSSLSKKARLAHWITGGTNRGPSTMTSFSRMTRDRNDIRKATKAWVQTRKQGLDEHQGRWGKSGVLGALDQARGTAPRPRGTALIRWFREGGGGDGGVGQVTNLGAAAGQPEMQQQELQRQGQAGPNGGDTEDDIYGAEDATMGAMAERGSTGDGDTAAWTPTGDAVGQQQTGEGGNDHEGVTARPAQQQSEETADR